MHQKSVYLIIFNATMIGRSLGKTLKGKEKSLKEFRSATFNEIERLVKLIDDKTITNETIHDTIRKLSEDFRVSFGQAQKAINVILKYHYYLSTKQDPDIKKELDCPIDKRIFIKLREFEEEIEIVSLAKLDESRYHKLQSIIANHANTCIEFDDEWDKQNLERAGIL